MATTEEATPATETIPVTTVTVTEPTTTTSPQKNTTLAYRVNRKIGMCKTWLPLLYPPPPIVCPPPSSTIIKFQSPNFQKHVFYMFMSPSIYCFFDLSSKCNLIQDECGILY